MNDKMLMNLANVDMLKGNINRMCVTNDIEELDEMHKVAQDMIDALYIVSLRKIRKHQDFLDEGAWE